jgi:hypothetical protein
MKHTQIVHNSEASLVDAINNMSTQLSFSGEKYHSIHSCFLQDVIEDMKLQLNMIRSGKGLTESRGITSFY